MGYDKKKLRASAPFPACPCPESKLENSSEWEADPRQMRDEERRREAEAMAKRAKKAKMS